MGMLTDIATAGGSKGLGLWGNKKRGSDNADNSSGGSDPSDALDQSDPNVKRWAGMAGDEAKRLFGKRSSGKRSD